MYGLMCHVSMKKIQMVYLDAMLSRKRQNSDLKEYIDDCRCGCPTSLSRHPTSLIGERMEYLV